MGLVLQPALSEQSREEIEQWLEQVRARRLSAAIEFHSGKNAKLEHEADRIQRKIKGQYEMLAKEIERVEKADVALSKRMVTIEALKQELGLTRDLIVVLDKAEAEQQ